MDTASAVQMRLADPAAGSASPKWLLLLVAVEELIPPCLVLDIIAYHAI